MNKKNRFVQHIPSWTQTSTRAECRFDTIEELMAFDLIWEWAEEDPYFEKYVKSRNLLIKLSHKGFYHYVMGYIDNPDLLELDEWEGWKFLAMLEHKEVVLSHEVESCSAGLLTLYDGRIALDVNYNMPYYQIRTEPVEVSLTKQSTIRE